MVKKILPFLISIQALWPGYALCQTQGNSISVSPTYGIRIFSVDQYKMVGNFYGAEGALHLTMANDGADWVRMLHVKDMAFATSYYQLNQVSMARRPGSQGILGNALSLSARLGMQLAGIGKTSVLFYPGFGVAYLTQNFQTTGNPLTGSHVNYNISLGLKVITPITPKLSLVYGVDVSHFSNGALSLPNQGLNICNASVGIDQSIGGQGFSSAPRPFKNYNKSSFDFGISLGRRGLVQSGAGLNGDLADYQKQAASHLYNSVLSLSYNYRLNAVVGLKVITDATYSYTKFDYNNFYATSQERATSFDQTRIGAGLGADIWLGRVAIEGSYGHYIHFNSYYPNEHWYWSSGAKLYLNKWLAAEGKIYLHGTEAELSTYGLLFTVR